MNDDPFIHSSVDPDLPATARAVASSIEALTEQVETLNTRIRRNRRNIGILAASLALDLLLTIGAGLLYSQLRTEQDRIDVVQEQALCPLYDLLISSESQAGRDRYPRGAAAYDQAFVTLRQSASALQCGVPR